ncbi:unnamed protein product [Larinioides sclopetarius]|uniref:Uncharacterized protein n=1 Tax=Larinioides sclopetarius TaxID=280406 RepID=A0AAV2BE46_9ARAC
MAAPMRIIFNNCDTFVKGILKLEVGRLAPTFFSNPSTISYNERRISTKKLDSYQYCQEVVRP